MEDYFQTYISSISKKFLYEETSELGYRADLEELLKNVFHSVNKAHIHHDPRTSKGNKPDFIVLKDKIPLLYLEVKNIGTSLDRIEKSEQMSRYFGYANLVLSDYVEFRFYRNGLSYGDPIKIGNCDLKNRTITPITENYDYLAKTLVDFTQSHKEPIKSATHLAKIMGGKGLRLRDNIRYLFDIKSDNNDDLEKLYKTIKELLVSDLSPHAFADMYAQTMVYGLFVARYYDKSLNNFTRQEARELIPNSNPLLRHFFDHIIGADFDNRLKYIVDELCEVFSHANVSDLMKQYFKNDLWGEENDGQDPVIHFYEDFLKEYDPELRKKMGAYYTPLPVVQFIVRSVNLLLKEHFVPDGLADNSKNQDGTHKVQILDPAVGTGTFLSETVKLIYGNFEGQEGRWPGYVHNDLLPRLHGFELMMTPYTIAHLKLGIEFRQTKFWDFHRRLGIYLTNSLEESPKQEQMFAFGLAESIAEESKEAAEIKNKKPVMVVLGNPPYSVSSSNKGEWIIKLIEAYKENLNERNIQPLSDDYIKFIRFAEHFIEKNGNGIVAMITNNSFIDGIIHRQMRKHLLETFDDIYVFDLHGNSKKKEETQTGGKDENVFDIQQGVAISIFVRKEGEKKSLGSVYYSELYGKRKDKFRVLNQSNISKIKWRKLNYLEPTYFFVPKDFALKDVYETGFKIDELFEVYNAGSATGKDSTFVQMNFDEMVDALNASSINFSEKNILDYLYRPFDIRKILYDNSLIQRLRTKVMDHMRYDNIALLTCKQQTSFDFQHVFLSRSVTDRCSVSLQTGEVGYVFPLYTYMEDGSRVPNLRKEIVDKIEEAIGKVTPQNIFDYIYAILHSPSYRNKYKEFLKIDFPRVPYPKDKQSFDKLVKLGGNLRLLHLLESPIINKFITSFSVIGSDIVEKIEYKNGNVYINSEQYFGNVPEVAWSFWIGGYQPAQKWLKDRKGRKLSNEDTEHYQKMIVAMNETDKIMEEIDKQAIF